MLRTLLFATAVLMPVLLCSGQDQRKRMDPDAWLSMDQVKAMLDWAGEKEGAFWLFVSSDAGRLNQPCGVESNWTLRNGDLRVVVGKDHVNRSRSHNLGFNLGTKSVVYNERVFSVGGRGFWNGHSKLIEFVEKSGEWEWVMTEQDGPECTMQMSSWFNPKTGKVFSIDEGKWGRSNEAGKGEVWCLDLSSLAWERTGRVNPKMELFVHGLGELIDLEDYFVWPGLHKSAIVKKENHETVFTTAWNDAEHKDALRQAKNEEQMMKLTTGNFFRVLSLDEQGQETVWLEWDVETAFAEAWELGDSSPWIVPSESTEPVMEVAENEDATAQIPIALWAVVLLIVAGVSFGIGRRGDTPSLATSSASGLNQPVADATGEKEITSFKGKSTSMEQVILTLISDLEEAGGRIMSTEEVNDFLQLGQDVSAESKRAKRAQFIRDVNRVYQMRYGKDMIVREKDLNDRRRTIYVIHPCSGTA